MEQEEKICKNCRYYMRHYIYAHTFFMGLSEGHCLKHKNFGKRSNNKFEINDTCENWESDEIRKIKTKDVRKHFLHRPDFKGRQRQRREYLINFTRCKYLYKHFTFLCVFYIIEIIGA